MKGLDTNVLVRYMVRDDPDQTAKATRAIEDDIDEDETIFISSIVLCELVWVLVSLYDYSRVEIVKVLGQILQTRQFTFEDKALLTKCLHDYQHKKGDFADYAIGRTGEKAGCNQTLSFDKALKDDPRFHIL